MGVCLRGYIQMRLKSMQGKCTIHFVALGYLGRRIYQQSQHNIIPHAMFLRFPKRVRERRVGVVYDSVLPPHFVARQ
jgi:hypothetical protein